MMAINEITDAEIREYILGKSPAEQADRLDELSFFDGYSERIGAVERELIDDYVSKSLDPDEELAFEAHYLTSPIRRERVRFAETLAKYSDDLQRDAIHKTERTSISDLFRQRFFILQVGAAALLFVLIGTFAWLIFRERSPEITQNVSADPDQQMQPTAENLDRPASPPEAPTSTDTAPAVEPRVIPERSVPTPTPRSSKPKEKPANLAIFVLTPALRSSSFQTINIPSGASSAEFRLRLEIEESGPVTAEVVDARTGSKIWSSQKVSTRKNKSGSTAIIHVPTRSLKGGEYQITLSRPTKDRDSEKVGDYFFRVAP